MQRNPDIIAIGAGPASLWMLIQAKLRNPELDILIFEKRQTYARTHLLTINPTSFIGACNNTAFQDLYQSFGTHINTNDLEAQLKDFAIKLGIHVEYKEITDVTALMMAYPETKHFIGAAGRRGVMRKEIFKDEMAKDSKLEFVAEVKYKAQGKTKGLNLIFKQIPLGCHIKHILEEHVGKEKDGMTSVTLRFFISEDEYEQMSEARAGNAFTLNDERIPPILKASMEGWLEGRAKEVKEVRVPESEKISVTELGVYASKEFTKVNDRGQHCILLGDEAFGVPFFRALNNALLCGTHLAKVLAEKRPLNEYAHYITALSKAEIAKAQAKGSVIDVGKFFAHIGRGDLPVIPSRITRASVWLFTPTLNGEVKAHCVERNRAAAAAAAEKKSESPALSRK